MALRDLFRREIERAIPPVVYFHEDDPERLATEVGEYIITGGHPEKSDQHTRVPHGIHEAYVHLLRAMAKAIRGDEHVGLPASWISGFYGSGKSSFAKLLGYALDGRKLPDGRSLGQALVAQDTSARAAELAEAWQALDNAIDSIAVVFDIGGVARGNEPIHSAIVRQVQERLGYCSKQQAVADFELNLERDGRWADFEQAAESVLGAPWSERAQRALASHDFSKVMHHLDPDIYTHPLAWYTAETGGNPRALSAQDATRAIRDMLEQRAQGKHLFLVVDEVSQYIHQDNQRMLALQSFVSDLGQRLGTRVWLLVTGQEQLEASGDTVLGKMKDRFPPHLRVHLAATNIRDVVHKRLLEKEDRARPILRALFQAHRNDLELYAWVDDTLSEDAFIDTYPLLPGHIDLLLQITSALRTRSNRAAGDSQAIRGLLQLMGDLFREGLADEEVGTLVSLDRIYDAQHSALDSDIQNTLARIQDRCARHPDRILGDTASRAAKAVSLLELLAIDDAPPVSAERVVRALYPRLGADPEQARIEEALTWLRQENLLGWTEMHGYKIQSSAGEEWERTRGGMTVTASEIGELVREGMGHFIAALSRPRLHDRPFPWHVTYADGRVDGEHTLQAQREPAKVHLDVRYLPRSEQDTATWVRESGAMALQHRIVWVVGPHESVDELARELTRSTKMANRHRAQRANLTRDQQRLLLEEEARTDDLRKRMGEALSEAMMSGSVYFRSQQLDPHDLGASVPDTVLALGNRFLPDLFPHHVPFQVDPSELAQLFAKQLTGLSPVFMEQGLHLFTLENGRYEATCAGEVPRKILAHLEEEAATGEELLKHFGGPPYGYPGSVVRASLLALLRAGKVEIKPEQGPALTAGRDVGAKSLFEKDRGLRRALVSIQRDGTDRRELVRLARLFKTHFGHEPERQEDALADAVADHFPEARRQLSQLQARWALMGTHTPWPDTLEGLATALDDCVGASRNTRATVAQLRRHRQALADGLERLKRDHAELTREVALAVQATHRVLVTETDQLSAASELTDDLASHQQQLTEALQAERPWLQRAEAEAAANALSLAYDAVRASRIAEQARLVQEAIARVQGRDGFALLDGADAHQVLEPLHAAPDDPNPGLREPSLHDLGDRFRLRLRRAEDEANDRLDALLERLRGEQFVTVDLRLRNRELTDPADLDALVDEIRDRIAEQLDAGRRVRLKGG